MNESDSLNTPPGPVSYDEIVLNLEDHEPLLRSPRLPVASIGNFRFPISPDALMDENASSLNELMQLDRQAALDWLLNLRAVEDYVYEEWVDDLRDVPDQLAILLELVNHAEERIREVKGLVDDVLKNGLPDPS